ncbi:MAG: protein kinase, partial [Clostridia bacterium]
MDKYIGKELNGRYVINEIIGIGGMAVVYKAYDKLVDRVVAVKILKEEFVENSQFRKRFSNESRVISMMSHVNIVDIYDVNLEGDLQYIVMEYVDGINLKEFMNKKGVLSASEALFFVSQILSALTHAHERGIVHRDIKPHNIMLIRDGTVKVGDFGIARAAKFDTVTMTDKAIGSVHYISPEQASGVKTDEKSDIYSVGVLLYEMVTGKLPFEGDTPVTVALMQVQAKPKLPSEIIPDIKRGLEEIIMKAMAKNPENRYQTALEMSNDIEKFKENPDIIFGYNLFIEESPTMVMDAVGAIKTPDKKKAGFMPIVLGIVTALVFFAVGIGIVLFVGSRDENSAKIDVPMLVGENYNDIINNKKYPSFKIIDSGKGEFSDKYEAGIITAQDIENGTKVSKNSTITVDISKGIATSTVPDVIGLTETQA